MKVDRESLRMILGWGFIFFNWIYMVLFTVLGIWPGYWVLLILYPSFLILVVGMWWIKRKTTEKRRSLDDKED